MRITIKLLPAALLLTAGLIAIFAKSSPFSLGSYRLEIGPFLIFVGLIGLLLVVRNDDEDPDAE